MVPKTDCDPRGCSAGSGLEREDLPRFGGLDGPVRAGSIADLGRRIAKVADALLGSLPQVLQSAAGSSTRPSRLVRELSLDKSLASRLVRSLRAESPLQLAHLAPSPIGLRIVLDAAESRGVDATLITRARGAVSEFENLLEDMPGGRSSLDALLSTAVPEVKERTELSAKQTVYRAMKQLLGLHCETNTTALILQPSDSDPRFADAIDLQQRLGICHLRPHTPVALHSATYGTEGGGEGPRMETIQGAVPQRGVETFLLPEFCTQPLPAMCMYHEGPHTILALDERKVRLHSPITITTGFIVRNGFLRHAQPDVWEEWRCYLLAYPSRMMVRDLYIRDDLYVGSMPEVRLEFPLPPGAKRIHSKDLPTRLTQLDLSAPVQQLGRGLFQAAIAGVPRHARILAYAFEQAGWDPARFRGYRCRIPYPVPMISTGWWIPLPQEPRRSTRAGP
ncbi:hypothetical protein JXA88_14075 [Candidatus Fermentibacteria bacterium]|nr:hypothetical protein [Candidatus Fermentibacteria bacterium]